MLADLWVHYALCSAFACAPSPRASCEPKARSDPTAMLPAQGESLAHDLAVSGRVLRTSGCAKVPNTLCDGKAHYIFCITPFYGGGRDAYGTGAAVGAGGWDVLMFCSRISVIQNEEPRFSKKDPHTRLLSQPLGI